MRMDRSSILIFISSFILGFIASMLYFGELVIK